MSSLRRKHKRRVTDQMIGRIRYWQRIEKLSYTLRRPYRIISQAMAEAYAASRERNSHE